uniref:Lipid-binding serum glycoprotein C-terminal domain-containing protein n=1 Tax=Malurus cyaneus samueli TaxID=2593467 RepID=A0A8C5TPA8_9PASS
EQWLCASVASILLSLLAPAHSTRSPDCGGILTPSGLRYRESSPTSPVPGFLGTVHHSVLISQHLPFHSSRKQIISVKVDEFSLTVIPDTGMRLSIEVDLGITSMRLSILADLHVEMNPEENLELVTSDCKPTLEEVQSTEEIDRSAPVFLLHPSAPFAAPFPITPSCQVQYLPLAAPMYSEQGIIISLQTTFQVAGTVIPLPVSPVPFSMPEPARSSSSHLILAFSEHFYTSLFSALEESGALNVSLLSSLTTATLADRITQMGSLFQEDLPVVLQAVTRSSPHVELEEDKATVKLFLTAQIGAGSSLFQSFLSVNVVSVELSLAASDVGPVLAALLEELFLPTIREEVPAQINVVLRQGVFLPHIASFTYTDVNVTIHKVRNETSQLLPAGLDLKEAWEPC